MEKIFWSLALVTVAGEFALPWLLKRRYPGYDSWRMVMSVLGCGHSPVRRLYNGWLLWMGGFLTVAAAVLYGQNRALSFPLALLMGLAILVFALGAGVLAGLFSVGETKEMETAAAKIHGYGAAVGFMALLFFPLLSSLLAWRQGETLAAILDGVAFVLAVVFFILFVCADKPRFQNTAVALEGPWQRLTLLSMYLPLVRRAAEALFLL